jgi:hypothetical protein
MPQPSSRTRISFLPPSFDFDFDAPRPGVERVLHQFLDGIGRTLDDFTGGDLVGDFGAEFADARHGSGDA